MDRQERIHADGQRQPPWSARNEITNYQRTIDLNGPASRATGETFAQDMFLNPATAGTYNQMITAQQTNWAQQLEIWLTPWGFLRGAAMYDAEAISGTMDGQRYTVITWMSPETQTSPAGVRYTVRGQLDDRNLVEWVETAIQDPIWGDLPVVNRYSEYRDFGGVMVPTQIVQERGGGAVFGVTVADATANPSDLMALMTPPAPAGGAGQGRGGGAGRGGGPGGAPPAAPPDPASLVERISDGVYVVGGPMLRRAGHRVQRPSGGLRRRAEREPGRADHCRGPRRHPGQADPLHHQLASALGSHERRRPVPA
jgi:hypothetical protein